MMKTELLPGYPAVWSNDEARIYRYTLWRVWREPVRHYAMFIGLNPSTATEEVNDPTVRRCIGYAQSWGYDALCMTNLFAFRATKPRVMLGASRPVGDANDRWLAACACSAGIVVAAWSKYGAFMGRDLEVTNLLDELHCLRTNADGSPVHPLYQLKTLEPILYRQREAS